MLLLSPKTHFLEFTPTPRKNETKRLAKKDPFHPNWPEDPAAARAARRTLRSLRRLLAQRELPAARAIRALARCQKRAKLPAEPDEDLEILLAVSTVLRELDGR